MQAKWRCCTRSARLCAAKRGRLAQEGLTVVGRFLAGRLDHFEVFPFGAGGCLVEQEVEGMTGCAAFRRATNAALLPVMGKLRACRRRQRTSSVKIGKFSGQR